VARFVAIALALSVGAGLAAREGSPRSGPRVTPLAEGQWTSEIRAVVSGAGVNGPITNDVRTLARHPELLKSALPFLVYIARNSELPPRHRELLALRAAWLCRAEYVWAQHVPIAQAHGIGPVELHRIAKGPDGWDPFEAALVRAADELHVNSFITAATWNTLAARYDRRKMLDTLFTLAWYSMFAGAMNAFAVQPDAGLTARLPTDVPYRFAAARLDEPQIRLRQPRIPPLTASELTPEARAILDPSSSGRLGGTAASYGHHPQLYQQRQILSDYLRVTSGLAQTSPVAHETVILRTALLNRSPLEWAAHQRFGLQKGMTTQQIHGILAGPRAPMWDVTDAALLQAVDDMQYELTVAPATWDVLAKRYDIQQLMDIVFTSAGYRFITSGQNALGLQSDQPAGVPPVWPDRRP
jgi:alkylhydroperoxidase family enzyme